MCIFQCIWSHSNTNSVPSHHPMGSSYFLKKLRPQTHRTCNSGLHGSQELPSIVLPRQVFFSAWKKKTPSELPPEKQNKKRQSSGSSRNKKNKPSGQNSKNSASRGQKIHSSSQRSKKRRNLSSTNQPHREPSGHSAQGMPTRPPEHCAGCPPGHWAILPHL